MSSENDTPPEIREAASTTLEGLVPEKSKERYHISYQKFMDWRRDKAYLGQLSETYKPSSLWSIYSMLRSVLNLKHNIDISKCISFELF